MTKAVSPPDLHADESWLPTPEPPPLAPGTVHVWRVPLDSAPQARQLRPLLSPEERERADRFYHEEHRVRFAVAHGWLRVLLARYAGANAAALRFRAAAFGKPYLDLASLGSALAGLHFNLSHSGDLALVAVARECVVGVDLEEWDDAIEHLRIAERFFSPAEREELRRLAPAQRTAGFFAAWTRKEAYIKGTGLGVSRGLDYFDVSLGSGADARLLDDRREPGNAARWALYDLRPAPRFSGALVVEGPHESPRRLDLVPSAMLGAS